jgi:hypothetical protein
MRKHTMQILDPYKKPFSSSYLSYDESILCMDKKEPKKTNHVTSGILKLIGGLLNSQSDLSRLSIRFAGE